MHEADGNVFADYPVTKGLHGPGHGNRVSGLHKTTAMSTYRTLSGRSFFWKEIFVRSCAHLVLVTATKLKSCMETCDLLARCNCAAINDGIARASLLGIPGRSSKRQINQVGRLFVQELLTFMH
jgi:hypothetical protein